MQGFSNIIMNTKIGLPRMGLTNFLCMETNTTHIRFLYDRNFVWNNTADTLTSMKFTGEFDVGTNIQIWKRG